MLEEAIKIAIEAHSGQKDKSGAPYILHPIYLMMQFEDDASRQIAILHDVVEDSRVSLTDLKDRGFSDEVVSGVDALTRREGESYEAFIERSSRHPLARKVKIADIRHNMDASRLPMLQEKDFLRLKKYQKALDKLLQVP